MEAIKIMLDITSGRMYKIHGLKPVAEIGCKQRILHDGDSTQQEKGLPGKLEVNGGNSVALRLRISAFHLGLT
jgi:hypothetical protein